MRYIASVLLALLVAIPLFLGTAHQGHAADLDSYRVDGVIAERYDGYVEMRASGPSDAASLVSDVNRQRRAIYEKRAKEQNVPVSAVGILFAKKIVESAPSGTYFKMQDGSYKRK